MTIWIPEIGRSTRPAYLEIADRIESDVLEERLAAGFRLPTHRALADALEINVSTVTRAYAEAERRGLVRGEVGRGTFVLAPAERAPAPQAPAAPAAVGPIDLSLNVPLEQPAPDLPRALAELARRGAQAAELLRYTDPAGTERARLAGRALFALHKLDVAPERIRVCAGAQHALFVCLSTLAEPGEIVLAEELTYAGFRAAAQQLRLRVKPVSIDAKGLVPEAFEAACRKHKPKVLYCVPTLHNPTGAVLPERRRREIARIAAEHDVAIVEDDIHRLLAPAAPRPIGAHAAERTYTIASTSKVLAGGLRVAFVATPPEAAEQLTRAIWSSVWMPSPLTVEIAARWIEDGTLERIAAGKREESERRQALARRVLKGHSLQGHRSAYHLWLKLDGARAAGGTSPRWTSADFTNAALRRGVSVAPSDSFWIGPGNPPHAVRISLSGAADATQLEAGLERLAALADAPPDSPRTLL